jgi:GNAT acetyltransferase
VLCVERRARLVSHPRVIVLLSATGMHVLAQADALVVRDWFLPERPGPLVGSHVLQTGYGRLLADRWPAPGAVLAQVGPNYALRGDPHALTTSDLVRARVDGFVETPRAFEPLVRLAYRNVTEWSRVIFGLRSLTALSVKPQGARVRKLSESDGDAVASLSRGLAWIADTLGGPRALAGSDYAWGAFVDGRLVSVACSFFVGEQYEDIGVVTEAEFRGRGLALACAHSLCGDIQERGRTPSWTTSPDNHASQRVAEKLGFTLHRHDRLLVVGRVPP